MSEALAFGETPRRRCPACGAAYYRSGVRRCPACQRPLPAPQGRLCQACGVTPVSGRGVKYCSDECREAGRGDVAVAWKLERGIEPRPAACTPGESLRRRQARESAASGYATPEQVAARWALFGGKCYLCGAPAAHMDHVKPLARGGSRWPSNLRPVCWPCNLRKGARWPYLPVLRPRELSLSV